MSSVPSSAWSRGQMIGVGAIVALLTASLVVVVTRRDGGDQPVAAPVTATADGIGIGIEIGIAEIVAPAEDALLVDPSGAVVPGDQVLVVLRPGSDRSVAERVAATVSGEVVGQIEFVDLWQIRIPPTDLAGLDTVTASLVTLDDVELASRNGTSRSEEEIWGERLDPMRDPPYNGAHGDGFRMIGVEAAWQYLRGSGLPRNPVKIGVTDDGLYRGTDPALSEFPPDRPGTVKVEFPDADAGEIDPANVPPDYTADVASGEGSHGTGVLTVLAGNPDDGGAYGVAGNLGDNLTVAYTNIFTPPYGSSAVVVPPAPPAAPDDPDDPDVTTTTAPIENVRWSNGVTYTTGNFKAIAEQIRGGAQVINMSWGCEMPPCHAGTVLLYRRFFEQLAERHPSVLFVAAAGNESAAPDGYWPGGFALPNMITVGNLENDGTTRSSSNSPTENFEVTLAAPGNAAVRGFGPNGTPIADAGGTSNAAPQVSGAAALLLSIKPDLTAAQIKDLLTSTARTTITRSDGTDHAIDADAGGRVLAVDLAVFELIKQERLRLGLDEPNPDGSSPLTIEQLGNNGVLDAVATSTADGWTVRGIVAGCLPGCTSVTITTSEGSSIGGSPTQVLSGPGEATWSVTFTSSPGTIVVRRTDNGAGSRILIDQEQADMTTAFTGNWTGDSVITDRSINPVTDTDALTLDDLLGYADVEGMIFGVSLVVSATPDGGGQVHLDIFPLPGVSQEIHNFCLWGICGSYPASIAWVGSTITFTTDHGDEWESAPVSWSGSLSPDGSTITGSWTAPDGNSTLNGTFTVSRL